MSNFRPYPINPQINPSIYPKNDASSLANLPYRNYLYDIQGSQYVTAFDAIPHNANTQNVCCNNNLCYFIPEFQVCLPGYHKSFITI